MSDPGDQGSADAAEPLDKRCSFCLKSSKEVETLVEGTKRGELGAAYICEECIELCGMILANPMRRVADTESGAAESPPARQSFKDTLDAAGEILRRLQSDPESLIIVLREMEQLLRRNDHPGQADYVAAIATIAEWDPCAAASALASGAMWGGSGAVWEVGRFGSEEEKRTYWKALCRLTEEMRSRGIGSARAESTAKILAEWIEQGL
jgi:hypothetical protein